MADYYVRLVTKTNLQKGVYKFLIKLSLASLLTSIVFFTQDFSIPISLMLGLYMVVFSINTLQLKVYFNFLIFKKNYFYVFVRLLPYLLLLVLTLLFDISNINIFILCLLVSEVFSFLVLYKGNIKLGFNLHDLKEKTDFNVLKFIIIYLSFALVQRMDMFVVEHFFPDRYVNYYQMISIFLIGVNPIVLVTSSSLLSILTKVDVAVFIKNKLKIALAIVTIAFCSGIVFLFLAPYLIKMFYPANNLLDEFSFISFNVIFFTILFFVSKAFIIKYVNMNKIFLLNILTILISLFFTNNFFVFTPVFFLTRGVLYLILLLILKKDNI
ncbi:hypothetical protein [Algibacter sp. R77976]|uniref:hypothetical protein n=1 Tax=Algibacter sp. R77976 TaxID=3093873 RepID=UPI0037C7F44F